MDSRSAKRSCADVNAAPAGAVRGTSTSPEDSKRAGGMTGRRLWPLPSPAAPGPLPCCCCCCCILYRRPGQAPCELLNIPSASALLALLFYVVCTSRRGERAKHKADHMKQGVTASTYAPNCSQARDALPAPTPSRLSGGVCSGVSGSDTVSMLVTTVRRGPATQHTLAVQPMSC